MHRKTERRVAEANTRFLPLRKQVRQMQRCKQLARITNRDEITRLSVQMQADLSKLHVELSERIQDGKRLRGQINSIYTRIC